MTEKTKGIIFEIILIILLILALWSIAGCSSSKMIFPDKSILLHQSVFQEATADKYDVYYEHVYPDGSYYVLWVVINDPNRSVNPGQFTIIEPRTGINATITAE